MLKLERLELLGFKSFHERTEVQFDAGVTAVVGPNGCGKSNLLDAMTWVLGEQSIKTLRGSSSEDLIFNGSESRRRVGMAEVTLRLRATNGDLPDGEQAVAVTRRLFRSGECEYLLNGSLCRLKDIQDLLYGSGLGVRAYSFIEQGKIGSILQAKPLDRRALIEEAAGITKFRAKKREAELKLESAEQNLVRVRDIIAEVERGLGSIRRQASRARRHERLRGELGAVLREMYAREAIDLERREDETVERHRGETSRRAGIEADLVRVEEEIDGLRIEIEKGDAGARGIGERLHQAEIDVDRNRNVIVAGRERLEELEGRLRQADEDVRAAQARLLELRSARARRQGEANEQAAREVEASTRVAAGKDEQRRAEAALAASEAELEARREELLSAVHALASASNAVLARSRHLEGLHHAKTRLLGQKERLEEQHAAGREAAAAATSARSRAAAVVLELESRVRSRFADAVEAARTREAARCELDAARLDLGQKEERARICSEITRHAEDAGERTAAAVRRLGDRCSGLVADHVRADVRYERAVEAALEPVLDALVVADRTAALAVLADAGEFAGQRLRILVADASPGKRAETAPSVAEGPGVIGWLRDLVTVGGAAAEVVARRLLGIVVVETLADALRLLGGGPWTSLCTLAGEVVERDGVVRVGFGSERGLLAMRREARELQTAVLALRQALLAKEEHLLGQASVVEGAEATAKAALDELHGAEKAALGAAHEQARAEEELRKLVEGMRGMDLELEANAAEQAEHERLAAAEGRSRDEIERSRHQVERAIEARRAEVDAARQEAQRRGRDVADAEAALARVEEILKAVAADLLGLGDAVAEREAAIQGLGEEAAGMRERSSALSREVESAEEALGMLLAEVLARKDELQREEEQSRRLRQGLVERELGIKEVRLAAERQRELVQAVEIERTRIEGEWLRLRDRCREDLQVELDELDGTSPPSPQEGPVGELDGEDGEGSEGGDAAALPSRPPLQEAALEDLRATASDLKGRLARLGPVNVLAIEEYQELKSRHDFLVSQAADLTQSIESLTGTIARINRTSRDRFLETFEEVNRSFQENFAQLFGGGRAELRLTDEDNLLETGIDIVAQPPGKRLQNILLLSGGEKALTAISLLFALFRYKPSPFCILDEVDAPLDERNIDRFLALLRSLSASTQFILITHSPRTMKVADTLYGVTMEEPGVSRLVSVRLGDAAA